jgi:hypothetical protein
MFRESESIKELHIIREKMYENTKHMSGKEFIEYIHKKAEGMEKKYGLKLAKASHAHK